MPIIPEAVLAKTGAVILSSTFEATGELQEKEDELRLLSRSSKMCRSLGPIFRIEEGTQIEALSTVLAAEPSSATKPLSKEQIQSSPKDSVTPAPPVIQITDNDEV